MRRKALRLVVWDSDGVMTVYNGGPPSDFGFHPNRPGQLAHAVVEVDTDDEALKIAKEMHSSYLTKQRLAAASPLIDAIEEARK